MARILNAPLNGRLLSSEAERATLGRIGTDGPCCRSAVARSRRFRKSADFIAATSGSRPESALAYGRKIRTVENTKNVVISIN